MLSGSASRFPALRFLFRWMLAAAVAVMAIGVSGCTRKKPQADPLIAGFEAPAADLAAMLADAAKYKGKWPNQFPLRWHAGTFELRPDRGAHKLRWTLEGEVTEAGPVHVQLEALVGQDFGDGHVVNCFFHKDELPAGPYELACESSPFRADDKPKTIALSAGLAQLQGYRPGAIKVDVVAVPVTLSAMDWFTAGQAALLGLVMLGLWWFFRRGR